MKRKPILKDKEFPFHITARANNRERFSLDMEVMWSLFESEFQAMGLKYDIEVHGFILMPNHYHLLMTAPLTELGEVMRDFNAHLVTEYNRVSARTGRLFGGPYFRSQIQSSTYFGHVLKYVYRNPVRGGLCSNVEDYPFSTLSGLLGNRHLAFPIHYTRLGMELALPSTEQNECLDWLNRPFPNEVEELIRTGLKKRVFDNLKCRETRKPYTILETLF